MFENLSQDDAEQFFQHQQKLKTVSKLISSFPSKLLTRNTVVTQNCFLLF